MKFGILIIVSPYTQAELRWSLHDMLADLWYDMPVRLLSNFACVPVAPCNVSIQKRENTVMFIFWTMDDPNVSILLYYGSGKQDSWG
jgi:hypothetical protein